MLSESGRGSSVASHAFSALAAPSRRRTEQQDGEKGTLQYREEHAASGNVRVGRLGCQMFQWTSSPLVSYSLLFEFTVDNNQSKQWMFCYILIFFSVFNKF